MPPLSQSVADVRRRIADLRSAGRTIGFVPTMGALHAGHTSLIDAAARDGHAVAVSIFVNPTQFGPTEDLARYPRTLEHDLALCDAHGTAVVFAPDSAEIYPDGDETRVRVGALADVLCGPWRPGHFEGVCTVVAKLFNIVQAEAAYFGQKDAQQAVILQRMARDLFMPTRVVVCPIVREADGLAMSSRNVYLSPDARRQALCLPEALRLGGSLIERNAATLTDVIAAMTAHIVAAGPCEIQYVAAVDPQTLQPAAAARPPIMLALAVKIAGTRLIDNVVLR